MEAVLFDLEGVLVYHTERQAALLECACRENGVALGFRVKPLYHLRSRAEYHSSKDFIIMLLRRNNTVLAEGLAERIEERYREYRRRPEFLANLERLYPGIREMLSSLKESCLRLAIVTNSNSRQADFLLDSYGIRKYFDCVVPGDSGLPKKPAPDMIGHALKLLKVEPAEALFVDDSESVMPAAKGLGLRTCGVLTGNARREGLAAAGTDIILEGAADLAKYLTDKGLLPTGRRPGVQLPS